MLFFPRIIAIISESEVNLPNKGGLTSLETGFRIVFGIAGATALLVVAYGALKFVLSQGNPQEVSKAKNTIIDALIGLALIVASGGIIAFVVGAL